MTINDTDDNNDDDADGYDNVDDTYSGDQHAYNAPKVGVLLRQYRTLNRSYKNP